MEEGRSPERPFAMPGTTLRSRLRTFPFYPIMLPALLVVGWVDSLSQLVTQSLLYGLICLAAGYRRSTREATAVLLSCLVVHWSASGQILWRGENFYQTFSESLLLALVTRLGRSLRRGEESLERSRARAVKLHEQLLTQLSKARQVQVDLLGVAPQGLAGFDLCVLCEVAVELGGDLFYVKELQDGLFLYVGDVSGKGPRAAIAAACVRALLDELVEEGSSPAQVLGQLQQRFMRLLPGDLFVTSFCARISGAGDFLVYANAGHDPPLLQRCDGVQELAGDSLPLGVEAGEVFRDHRLVFGAGDRLLVYTDGLTDAFQPDGERLGPVRVEQCFLEAGSAREVAKRLMALAPEPRADDVLVLVVGRHLEGRLGR